MKAYLVLIAITFSSLCDCKVLEQRDDERGSDSPKIVGFKQFEDFLKLVQKQILNMNDQFTRILIPREEPKSTLSQESLNSFMKQVKRGIDILEESMKSLQDQFSKVEGGLQAETTNSNQNFQRVPFLSDFLEYIALFQKQLAGFANNLTRVITGGQFKADGTISYVPILKEMEEFISLIQKQMNRYGESLRKIITNGGQQI